MASFQLRSGAIWQANRPPVPGSGARGRPARPLRATRRGELPKHRQIAHQRDTYGVDRRPDTILICALQWNNHRGTNHKGQKHAACVSQAFDILLLIQVCPSEVTSAGACRGRQPELPVPVQYPAMPPSAKSASWSCMAAMTGRVRRHRAGTLLGASTTR